MKTAAAIVAGWTAVAVLSLLSGTAFGQGVSQPHIVVNPGWAQKPTARQLDAVFPKKALREDIEGKVWLACSVQETGQLVDCYVTAETPVGEGFGTAALGLTGVFKMTPKTVDGVPQNGAKIVVPITFLNPNPKPLSALTRPMRDPEPDTTAIAYAQYKALYSQSDLDDFLFGRIYKTDSLATAMGWGAKRRTASDLFQRGQWEGLARLVLSSNYSDDLVYFYLSSAAFHLGYYGSARKYISTSYYLSNNGQKCKIGILNNCDGHVFPAEQASLYTDITRAMLATGATVSDRASPERLAVRGYMECFIEHAGPVDNGSKPPPVLAAGAAQNCEERRDELRAAMEQGWTPQARAAFDRRFDEENINILASIVMTKRAERLSLQRP